MSSGCSKAPRQCSRVTYLHSAEYCRNFVHLSRSNGELQKSRAINGRACAAASAATSSLNNKSSGVYGYSRGGKIMHVIAIDVLAAVTYLVRVNTFRRFNFGTTSFSPPLPDHVWRKPTARRSGLSSSAFSIIFVKKKEIIARNWKKVKGRTGKSPSFSRLVSSPRNEDN